MRLPQATKCKKCNGKIAAGYNKCPACGFRPRKLQVGHLAPHGARRPGGAIEVEAKKESIRIKQIQRELKRQTQQGR